MPTSGTPDDYYIALGKLTFAASRLTECCIVFSVWLSDPAADTDALDMELRKAGWAASTKALRSLIKERMTLHYQKRLLPLLDRSDKLRHERNQNVHALWQTMHHADTWEFAHVLRVRKNVDKSTTKPALQIDSPAIAELTKLVDDIRVCAQELQTKFKDATDLDTKVRRWREKHGF